MIAASSCLVFDISCETLVKGGLSVFFGFVLFVGTVLLLVGAVFGRRMGALIVATCFFGWMTILSAIWLFGFWSQGPSTPTNLGPRGVEPGWVVESAGTSPEATYPAFESYPAGEAWRVPGTNTADSTSVQSVTSSAQGYLATIANEEQGKEQFDPGAVQTSEFTVQDIRFATDGDVSLAAATAFYNGGGPLMTLYMRHDSGSVPIYSWIFLIVSAIVTVALIPLLDRAERKRKEILTGGTAPPWYGPA